MPIEASPFLPMKRSRVAVEPRSASSAVEAEAKRDAPGDSRDAAPRVPDATDVVAFRPAAPLLGTLRYTADTFGCTCDHLDVTALGVLARVSRAHRAATVQYVRAMPSLFINRGLAPVTAWTQFAVFGLGLAAAHARRLRLIVVRDAPTPYSVVHDTISATGSPVVAVNGRPHAELTRVKRLLPELVETNSSTLACVTVPRWCYSTAMLQAMTRCYQLESLAIPHSLAIDPDARRECEHIVRNNCGRLTLLDLKGVHLDSLGTETLARLSLTDLTLSLRDGGASSFVALAACTTLRKLDVTLGDRSAVALGGRSASWRHLFAAIAGALPKLTRLKSFKVGSPGWELDMGDLEWRFAPSVRSVECADSQRMPRLIGAGVRRFEAESSTALALVRIAENFTHLDNCCIRTLRRTAGVDAGHLRAAFERGLFGGLRVAQFCGVDDMAGNLLLGGASLVALARSCPLLEELDAQVHATFNVDHLADILERTPRMRALHLSFSERVDGQDTRGSCISGHPAATTFAPIVLPDLEVLLVPVCSDDLVARLVCSGIRRLVATGRDIALRRWPRFPTLTDLSVQLDSDIDAMSAHSLPLEATGELDAMAETARPDGVAAHCVRLSELAVAWSRPRPSCNPLLWNALGMFPSVLRLQVTVHVSLDEMLDALASPSCPPSGLRQLVVKAGAEMRESGVGCFAKAAVLAAKHPLLKNVFCLDAGLLLPSTRDHLALAGISLDSVDHASYGSACDESPCYAHLH